MALKKCEWCNKLVETYVEIKDEFDKKHNVCSTCSTRHAEHKCIDCGSSVDLFFNGKCIQCAQKDIYLKEKKKTQARLGVADIITSSDALSEDLKNITSDGGYCAALDFTTEEYKFWIESVCGSIGNGAARGNNILVDEKDIHKNQLLKRIWIITKIAAAGVPFSDVDKYASDLEYLLDAHFFQLTGKECYIVIADTPALRKKVKGLNYLGDKENVFLVVAE